MNQKQIRVGLRRVGDLLTSSTTIALGRSAALVLRGDISREAGDCDVTDIQPASAKDSLASLGNQVAQSLDLHNNWLNAEIKAWQDEFPLNWKDRLEAYDTFGHLTVVLMSKSDCMCTKLLRLMRIDPDQDLVDIKEMNLTSEERSLVSQYIDSLEPQYDMSRIRIGLKLL